MRTTLRTSIRAERCPADAMNKLSARMHRSRHARAPHPVLFVDETPLHEWIKGVVCDAGGVDSTDSLVPAQGWLLDEGDGEHAWKLLSPREDHSSTIVPMLVCPDDMDMSCTVAVVEQMADGQNIRWVRTGRALDVVNGIVTSVAWTAPSQTAVFSREEFGNAVAELRRLTDEVWK